MAKKCAYPNPYPSEHAARLHAPGSRYVRYRALGYDDKLNTFPSGVRPVYGILRKKRASGAKTEIQALRFDKVRWTPERAKAWLKKHGMKPILFEPASAGAALNPSLLLVSNPRVKGAPKKPDPKAVAAYKKFHMSSPGECRLVKIPAGWPKSLVVIGSVDRLDVSTPDGREINRRYSGDSVKVCMTASRRELFILSTSGKKLGVKSGTAMRIDYTVPPTSGRNKWARRWWHPHDTGPKLTLDRSGTAARVKGPKLRINVRGIIG